MILLYHSIIPDDSPPERWCVGQAVLRSAFERQVRWLANHHPIVSLVEYVAGIQEPEFKKHKPIAITFDDGFDITFQCVFPFLVEMNIPVTIFVATGHLDHGELLWFSYLKALCFEHQYEAVGIDRSTYLLRTMEQRRRAWNEIRILAKASGDPLGFCGVLSKTYPLNPDVTALYAGMTHEQLGLASENNILELGAHTMTHPYLNRLSIEKQEREIIGSRSILSEITGKPVRYFAYPGGEYSEDTVELVKTAGYEAAFAVIPQKKGIEMRFEIGRIGIYSQSLIKLQMKTLGFADVARSFGLKVG